MIQPQQLTLNTEKMLLSGSRRVYKTEGFIFLTRKIMAIDAFVSRVAESIFYAEFSVPDGTCIAAETEDKQYTLFFRQNPADSRLRRGDLVFYKFISANTYDGGVDRSLSEYLLSHPNAQINVREAGEVAPIEEFAKIYLVSGGGVMNFPLLNETQRKIVETENSNMLVQGVAGSGKTNVCVEKIVYCACRNYRGRVLYTTFSRALLAETQNRVSQFLRNIEDFLNYYERGKVVFIDENHKRAVENKLGILFDTDDDGKIVESLKRIAAFLREKVDYFLIEDIYEQFFEKKPVAGESVFLQEYLPKNRMSGALEKIKNVAAEIIYKEIYGMVFGKYELSAPKEMMSREEYFEARKDSFSRAECEVIYNVACDYQNFLAKNNLTDNNLMSRELLATLDEPLYSVGIIDEAQDFTQVNLCLIKKISLKLFCVGDALQMINPSYFNFGYIKRLMYGEVTGVTELKHNYRSTQTIENIAETLGELNRQRFGTHSFVLQGESVQSSMPTAAVFVKDDFAPSLTDRRFENVTVVVASQSKKEQLRAILGRTEILTVAEAKGLERNIVVLVDVLTDNIDKWNYLENMALNRKTADENSVFRYYFNLFYVGVSRAKQYLFVAESQYPKMFETLFNQCFQRKNKQGALVALADVVGKIELDDEELIDRIQKFCALEQYENARFAADRLSTEELREKQLAYIYVHSEFLRYGRVRDAGVEYWRRGMDAEAREMFMQSGDEELFPLMDACKQGGGALNVDIVKFYPLVTDNDLAKRLIIETVQNDCNAVLAKQRQINELWRKK